MRVRWPARAGSRSTTDTVEDSADASAEAEEEAERGPLRRCVVTRAQGERGRMLRFVVAPDGSVVSDLAARLPGRGIWLSARADVIHSPRVAQAFARAARAQVRMPDDLTSVLAYGLAARIADLIGFARRAGQAVAGFQKAREWLQAGRVALIIQASDGSLDERRRLIGLQGGAAVAAPLPASRLGAVFGREAAVHVAIGHGKLASHLMMDIERLAGVTGDFEDADRS